MRNNATVDVISSSGNSMSGSGAVAQKLLDSGFNVNALRTNDVLRKDEWIAFDNTVVEVARQRLIGVGDLMSAGLRFPITNALGVTRVEWEKMSDMEAAEVSMSGVTDGRSDRVTFDLEGVPLPIIHKDFNINVRALHASRNGGTPLDTTQAALAARLVAEKIEGILFDGYAAIKMQSSTIYGYTTFPQRNTGTLYDWDDSGTDGSEILSDVLEMIQDLYSNNMYGPFIFYVPLSYYVKLGEDFKTNSDKSILQRLMEVPGVKDIRPSENLANEVVAVQMSQDVVDMVDGIQPTTIMWESHGGMVFNFKVLAIMVPRFKSTKSGQCGIAHYSP